MRLRTLFSLPRDFPISDFLSRSGDESKSALRRAALARRDELHPFVRAAAADVLARRAFPVAVQAGAVVSGYWPIRSEIDPRPLIQQLARQGARLALPVVVGRDVPLVMRAWADGDALAEDAFGLHAPLAAAPVLEPDIVLVPLAAFDRTGHRIGYGAGHYDRTIAALRARKEIVTVGLAFAVQEIPAVPHEAHDISLDFVLTERDIVDCRGAS